jgi:hypothetical protein
VSPTPLELLLSGRYQELLARMRNPAARGQLLAEVVGAQGPPGAPADAVLELRQLNMLAAGDWSWGLLTAQQRRQFLVRDAALLRGSGTPDAGAAQIAALTRLKGELGNLYDSLDLALQEGDLGWLMPLAEHLADLLEITGEFASMQERYTALLQAARKLDCPPLELHARLGLSLALSRLGLFVEAQAQANPAALLAQALGDAKLRAAALHLDGSAKAMAGDYAAARTLLSQALDLRRELGERHGVIATMSNLAYVEQCQGRGTESRALLNEALEVCRELGDRRGEAMFLQNLGSLAYGAGEYGSAHELAGQALSIYRELDERRGIAAALCALGFAQYGAGSFAAAREQLLQALAACRELGDRNGESLALIVLGNLACLVGDDAQAREYFAQALELCRESGDRQGEARAQCGLAHVAQRQGLVAESAGLLAQALAVFMETGEQPGIADCLVYAAGLLAGLAPPSHPALAAAALALGGARFHAAALQHHFDPLDQRICDEALHLIDDAAASGALPATEAAQLAAQSESMSLEEHAASVLQALEQLAPTRDGLQ